MLIFNKKDYISRNFCFLLKKAISYLLLVCFILYNLGYYIVYFTVNFRIEKNWVEKIYDSKEILNQKILKIPITLPYTVDDQYFKEINSLFEKDGEYFRIIKQKYANDTLTVVYVADNEKNNLETIIKKWAASMAQEGQGNSHNVSFNSFVKDYMRPFFAINLDCMRFRKPNPMHKDPYKLFENLASSPNSPPPEFI